jgi:hypothetical protein
LSAEVVAAFHAEAGAAAAETAVGDSALVAHQNEQCEQYDYHKETSPPRDIGVKWKRTAGVAK